MENPELVPPELSEGESYHVFCSYSSADSDRTLDLIQQLEDRGLKVCNHERDFTPGRGIMENMSDCIKQSQKMMLVLSPEFLRSRWCLMEANMSMFTDCVQGKPMVPVLLQRDVSIPLYLSHLTYVDVQNPGFIRRLLKFLCTPNRELQAFTMVPYQPPSLYNGKNLEPLPAVNKKQVISVYDCGLWGEMVPDQLRLIIQQPEKYKKAINIINSVARTKVRFTNSTEQIRRTVPLSLLFFVFMILLMVSTIVLMILIGMPFLTPIVMVVLFPLVYLFGNKMSRVYKYEQQRIVDELQKAIGQANNLLFDEKVLIGYESNSKLLLVYVSVDDCRQELSAQSQDDQHFHKAILKYSCAYARCLSKGDFPTVSNSGHLQGSVCFCQYVSYQLETVEETEGCKSCCCQTSSSAPVSDDTEMLLA